jgi:hypothetical protein
METTTTCRELRQEIEDRFVVLVEGLTGDRRFRRLAAGTASPLEYEAFVTNLVRTHLRSPQLFAFLYALAPPASASDLGHNLLEEMGAEEDGGLSHPDLLRTLATGAGLSPAALAGVESDAEADLRRLVTGPLLYPTLREVGLAALVEIISFEYMLSRVAATLASGLVHRLGLTVETLAWFHHHAEVDVGHAEQGLDAIVAYASHYGIDGRDAVAIADTALAGNPFLARYFR